MEIFIQCFYKYNGREHNELIFSQSSVEQAFQEVVVKNSSGGEMLKTRDFNKLAQFVKDLEAGKYAKEVNPGEPIY